MNTQEASPPGTSPQKTSPKKPKRVRRILMLGALVVLLIGFMLPEHLRIPVEAAGPQDWNHETFWYDPWGASGVHKGIDIFAEAGRPVLAASGGIVLYTGVLRLGGNVVVVLGPKWRLHYYAHLQETGVSAGHLLSGGTRIGTVGDTGNAKGKPPHLHYSLISVVPYPWRIDTSRQGWLKMFFLDPGKRLLDA